MGKIKIWKIDVWFIENKNINIFREHTNFWYFMVWLNPIKPTQRLKGLDFGQNFLHVVAKVHSQELMLDNTICTNNLYK